MNQRPNYETIAKSCKNTDSSKNPNELYKILHPSDIHASHLVLVHPCAQADLEAFGSLEELQELFDLRSGVDTPCAALRCDDFCAFLAEYRQDKATCLSSVSLQHLRFLRRRVLGWASLHCNASEGVP